MANYGDEAELPYVGGGPLMKEGRLRNPPVRKILEDQILNLKKELEARENLIKKLDENKNVEELLDALRKVGI